MDPQPTITDSWWWCFRCHAFTDLKDPGEPFKQCAHCGSRRLEYRAPDPAAAPSLKVLRAPTIVDVVPDDAHPIYTVKRLPSSERPSLTQMAAQGFHQCQACRQVTKLDEADCCVLCGSSEVTWTPPVFEEDKP